MARKRRIRRAVRAGARRAKSFLGLSAPVITNGLATGAGVLTTNWVTGYAVERFPAVNSVWGKLALKVGTGVALKMLAGRFAGSGVGNALLAGSIASATLTLARQYLPNSYDTRWGLAGMDDLSGLTDSNDLLANFALDDTTSGVSGLFDSNALYAAAGM